MEEVSIAKIKPAKVSLRSDGENLEELRSSIQQNGLLHPLIVRPLGQGFEVVAGNRRLQACKSLKYRKVPCHVIDLDDKEAFLISVTENVQRETLNPLEEARAFKQHVELYGWGSISDLAKHIGKSVSYVSRRIKLLSLPAELQQEILRQRKSSSVVSEILAIGDHDMIREISQFVFSNEMTERDARMLVKRMKKDLDMMNETIRIPDSDATPRHKPEERILKKFITVLKIAHSRIGDIINESTGAGDWRFTELMLERRYALHEFINSLIVLERKIGSYNANKRKVKLMNAI
ncbi:MAG: ParB/RepB/Spo0J family partition protein [Nitrososphaera sp.]